jgi:ribulose-phosphate 3-epimerase
MLKIAPSILAANPLNLQRDCLQAEKYGAYRISVDVMDGHFVPDITFGHNIVAYLNRILNIDIEVHLMVENPSSQLELFLNAGADVLTFHIETSSDVNRLIDYIQSNKKKAGIAINPDTNIENVEKYLEYIDELTVMTVVPGKGGQSLIVDCLDKVKQLRKIKEMNNLGFDIQVDGGVKKDNIKLVNDAGADIAVAGTAIFNSENSIQNNLQALIDALR